MADPTLGGSSVQRHKMVTSAQLAGKSKVDFQTDKQPIYVSNNIAVVSFSAPNLVRKGSQQHSFGQSKMETKPTKQDRLMSTKSSSSSLLEGVASSWKSNRFNPFNKSSDDSENSCSNTTAESESMSVASSGSLDTSLAELGLTEDYFSHPEGHLRLHTADAIEYAIDQCKEMILKTSETSSKRKKLVKNLVDLRIKLQEIKEGPEVPEPRSKLVYGHRFRKKTSRSMKNHCDCCSNLIWGMIQVWYRCKECNFNCHLKCIDKIRRPCVSMAVKNFSGYQLNICPEVGLSKQQYSCIECKSRVEISGSDEARMCDYTGLFYCSNCHWNDTLELPARVLHNWDHTPYKVCRQSFQLLNALYHKPLLEVQEINPLLFNYVEELSDIRKMREDIIMMKMYFLTCSKALEAKLLWKLQDRQHFVDNSRMYSMRDLVETKSGTLSLHLSTIHATYAQHIKLDCPFCQAKGFICEICNSGETLFPFDVMVSICPRCSAVFHVDCFSCVDTMCPRCKRKQSKRLASFSISLSSSEEDEPERISKETLNYLERVAEVGSSEIASDEMDGSTQGKDLNSNGRVSTLEFPPPKATATAYQNWVSNHRKPSQDSATEAKTEQRHSADHAHAVKADTRWSKRFNNPTNDLTVTSPPEIADNERSNFKELISRRKRPNDVSRSHNSIAKKTDSIVPYSSPKDTNGGLFENDLNPSSISAFLEYKNKKSPQLETKSKSVKPNGTNKDESSSKNPFIEDDDSIPPENGHNVRREGDDKFTNPFLESEDDDDIYDDSKNPFASGNSAEYDDAKNPFS